MRELPKPNLVRVEPVWRGETCVCLASGPSLTREDVEFVRGKARVIAVNNCVQLAPWADVLWATDAQWWRWYPKLHEHFQGLKYSLHVVGTRKPKDVLLLKKGDRFGFASDPRVLNHGGNGGYQAVHLAAHFGVRRIVLLGYDMKMTGGRYHWHRDHPHPTPNIYGGWRHAFATLAGPLRAAGIEVINCTRETALTCFPTAPLESVLPTRAEAA